MGVRSGDGGQAAAQPRAAGGLVLQGAVAAVDPLDAVEQFDQLVRLDGYRSVAGGMGQVHQRALIVAVLTEDARAADAGRQIPQSEGQHVAQVGRDLNAGQDQEIGGRAELLQRRPGPDAIVFREHHPVQAAGPRQIDHGFGGDVGVGGEGGGVDVEVDLHSSISAG